jgi:hypothetical protein
MNDPSRGAVWGLVLIPLASWHRRASATRPESDPLDRRPSARLERPASLPSPRDDETNMVRIAHPRVFVVAYAVVPGPATPGPGLVACVVRCNG